MHDTMQNIFPVMFMNDWYSQQELLRGDVETCYHDSFLKAVTLCSNEQLKSPINNNETARYCTNATTTTTAATTTAAATTAATTTTTESNKKKRGWKRPSDKPKRPACAYNLYFHLERERILSGDANPRRYTAEDVARAAASQLHDKPKRKHVKTHGKIGFRDLSRMIAASWKRLSKDDLSLFDHQAVIERSVYTKKLASWKARQFEASSETSNTGGSDVSSTDTNGVFYFSEYAKSKVEPCLPSATIPIINHRQGYRRYSDISELDNDKISFDSDALSQDDIDDDDNDDVLLQMANEIYQNDLIDLQF